MGKKKLSETERLSKSGYITIVLAGLFLFFVLTGYSFSLVLNNSIRVVNGYIADLAQNSNIKSLTVPIINIDLSAVVVMYIILFVFGIILLYLYINYRLAKELKK